MEINRKWMSDALEIATNKIIDNYIFLKKTHSTRLFILKQHLNHCYDDVLSVEEFCQRVTNDLFLFSQDKHLRLIPLTNQTQGLKEYTYEDWIEDCRRDGSKCNFGMTEIRLLEGNIGYLAISRFYPAELAASTAAHALNFLSNCYGLIIDVRDNPGGDPAMVSFLCSYFLKGQVHLDDLHWRKNNEIRQFWTLPYVPGTRLVDCPIVILTSDKTFSAAEEFSYILQKQGRAMIMGSRTAGGANPGQTFYVNDAVEIFVPTGRVINPLTLSNWEGTGVIPDIELHSMEDCLAMASEKMASVISSGVQ